MIAWKDSQWNKKEMLVAGAEGGRWKVTELAFKRFIIMSHSDRRRARKDFISQEGTKIWLIREKNLPGKVKKKM